MAIEDSVTEGFGHKVVLRFSADARGQKPLGVWIFNAWVDARNDQIEIRYDSTEQGNEPNFNQVPRGFVIPYKFGRWDSINNAALKAELLRTIEGTLSMYIGQRPSATPHPVAP